jgi:cytochrome c-type biogenesis protein CcmH
LRRLALALFATLLIARSTSADDARDREYETATRMILCDCGCPPQSLHDCACGHAEQVRKEIAAEIASGKTGQQVIDAYVAKFGDKIRVVPVARGFGLLAWIGPAAALFLGAGTSVLILRRWRRASPVSGAAEEALPPPVTDAAYRRRIEARLEEYE